MDVVDDVIDEEDTVLVKSLSGMLFWDLFTSLSSMSITLMSVDMVCGKERTLVLICCNRRVLFIAVAISDAP